MWGKTYYEGPTYSIEKFMGIRNIPGVSIAVINNYQLEWAKAYGLADNKKKIPTTLNTSFNAGSISKSMCTVGFLKLSEDGKIKLDGELPDLKKMALSSETI